MTLAESGSAVLDVLGERLGLIYGSQWSGEVESLLCWPDEAPARHSIGGIVALIERVTGNKLPDWLLPLAWVDKDSIACLVIDGPCRGQIRRLHLRSVPSENQLALLDVDPLLYIASLDEELTARDKGLKRVLDEIGPAYEQGHLAHEKRPRDYVVRPVRIACQNVIVALGAIAQDSSFDGLSVPAWQTCEVPHVATHEANRALAALMLCDAFQNGGTMEIRFDRRARVLLDGRIIEIDGHPEKAVPASLRRFGRTVGIILGADDSHAITPREARELFLAITPMPAELRERVDEAVENRGISPERICFLLLSQVWREIEMDYLLATSSRTSSILDGGAAWTDRLSRHAESEICRGAVTAGMLYRRLNATDTATADPETAVRVVEDRTKGIGWSVLSELAAVTFTNVDPAEHVPWTAGVTGTETLTVFPRTAATDEAIETVCGADVPGHRALLLPADVPGPAAATVTVLRCPDRLADIDKNIEDRLLKSRISRG